MRTDARSNHIVTRRCLDCSRQMRGREQAYHYTECGLSSVKLLNIVVFECECGARVPVIPSIRGLHFMIALKLLRKRSLLAGEEIRFLRKMGGMSQGELAKIMGVDKTRPSKWESAGGSIGGESDRFLRSICFLKMLKQVMGKESDETVDGIAESDQLKSVDLEDILKSIDQHDCTPQSISMPWPPKDVGDGALPVQ